MSRCAEGEANLRLSFLVWKVWENLSWQIPRFLVMTMSYAGCLSDLSPQLWQATPDFDAKSVGIEQIL